MNYKRLKELFILYNLTNPTEPLKAHIVFTEDSFPRHYSRKDRTYEIASESKVFGSNYSNSLYGSCADGGDHVERLDHYMAEELGGESGWIVENCYLVDNFPRLYIEDTSIIHDIVERFQNNFTDDFDWVNPLLLPIILIQVHLNILPLNMQLLYYLDDVNFTHDIVGIYDNFLYSEYTLKSDFRPRSARKEVNQ